MIGDRLDTDISPANKFGMKTIRTINSIFKLQEPITEFEQPNYTGYKLKWNSKYLREILIIIPIRYYDCKTLHYLNDHK